MKIKVIDLLNKIANGEEVPKKIKYKDDMFTYYEYADEIRKYYIYEKHNIYWFDREYFDLDTEVEIIEEDKEIEKINMEWFKQVDMFDAKNVELAIEMIAKQTNELIKAVNELKKGK